MEKQSGVISVLITDDHKMVREGIRIMLEAQNQDVIFKITEAESGEEALELIDQEQFDIVLMDHHLQAMSGAETVVKIIEKYPDTKILAVSNYDEYACITEMIKAGAKGYILKNISPDELKNAIETIMKGKNYYSNDVAVKLINVNTIQNHQPVSDKSENISKREIEILKMIANELTNEQIAERLNIAKRTVDSHRQNLLNKLKVRNTAGLINYAHRNHLI